MADIVVHVHSLGIAADLSLGMFYSGINLSLRRITLKIFQLDDIQVFHILEYLTSWAEEDVGIAVLVVKLGDGTIEATLYVPAGTRRAYELDTYRRRFWNFTEYTATGISSVKTDTNAPLEQIYDIDGRHRDTMHRGLNIVRS